MRPYFSTFSDTSDTSVPSGSSRSRGVDPLRDLRRTNRVSPCHELMVGAFGNVVPGADERLKLRE